MGERLAPSKKRGQCILEDVFGLRQQGKQSRRPRRSHRAWCALISLQGEYKAMAGAKLQEEHIEKDEEGVYIVRCASALGQGINVAGCTGGTWAP